MIKLTKGCFFLLLLVHIPKKYICLCKYQEKKKKNIVNPEQEIDSILMEKVLHSCCRCCAPSTKKKKRKFWLSVISVFSNYRCILAHSSKTLHFQLGKFCILSMIYLIFDMGILHQQEKTDIRYRYQFKVICVIVV